MAIVYGTYTFPIGWYVQELPLQSDVPSSKLPRADGARLSPAYLTERVFRLKGSLLPNGTPLSNRLDDLRAACQKGPQNLYPAGTGRYLRNVVKRNFRENYQPSWPGRIVDVEIDLVTGDPFAYESSVNTVNSAIAASGTTWTCSAGGNAPALPSTILTVGGSGAIALAATLTNVTTGESCTLTGNVNGGDLITIDSLAQTVTIAGVDRFLLFDGLFPTLLPNTANVFRVDFTGGTIVHATSSWQNRWY